MDDATTALVVLGLVVALFVWNRLPVGVVAILATLALWATGLVTTEQAVAGFGDPVVIFIATLFVVSEGIDSTGVTTWAGQGLLERAGTGHSRVLVAVCLLSALLTSLITLNGAVAALLPLVVLLAQRIGQSPSQLLMPVAFAGSAGGLLMLMSSPVNVIVSEAAEDAGEGAFSFFSFALVGLPLLLGTVLICLFLGGRLLPRRVPEHTPPDLGRHAETLEGQYQLTDGFYRLRVRSRSDLIGRGLADVERRRARRGPGRRRGVAGRAARPRRDPRRRRPGGHGSTRGRDGLRPRPGAGRQHDRLGRRPGPAHPGGGRRGGRRTAAVEPGRRAGLPRHEAAARPGDPGRAAAGEGPRRRSDGARRGRRDPPPRALVGPRPAQPGPRRAAGRLARPRPPPGGPVGPEGDPGGPGPGRPRRDARLRTGAARDRRTGRGRRDGAGPGGHRPAGLPLRLLADRGPGRRPDPAVHRDPDQRRGRPGRLGADRRRRHRARPTCCSRRSSSSPAPSGRSSATPPRSWWWSRSPSPPPRRRAPR